MGFAKSSTRPTHQCTTHQCAVSVHKLICPTGAAQNPVQSSREKYSASRLGRNSFMESNCPVPTRGVSRSSGRWVRDAMDAAASGARIARGRMMLSRTAKSCGPDAPTLASSGRNYPPMTVAKEPGHRGATVFLRWTYDRLASRLALARHRLWRLTALTPSAHRSLWSCRRSVGDRAPSLRSISSLHTDWHPTFGAARS